MAPISAQYLVFFAAASKQEACDEVEQKRYQWPSGVQQVLKGLDSAGLTTSSRIFHVPPSYYEWPLYQRALSMGAPSPAHLCKMVVMENKRWQPAHCKLSGSNEKRRNLKYIGVVVQYVQTVNVSRMTDYVRTLSNNAVARNHFKFRLADEHTARKLTGFAKNGVSPVGMRQQIPLVVCAAIQRLRPPVVWMGGGDIDFKLAMPVQALLDSTQGMIADISDPAQ
ncbi:hypothetical protein COEREDRAFT_47363 [Coemansia reversa NRRL 1564]|uniref:YbaK/aminoacyl-tRNA synthetase-associated domain-containing protein n=1 Tax=Coemansia reversa (strain ATCC 12441 / NRRL 1564) TaxID=763665 RepID=A0A2G5B5D9_COERN|nr:hypothetical protein COEREDRAFT_47363 [Coemansia reversa NRRL 1564]|eukprot:PIA14225.1 hypothetical protein COEREDRAFT_47363 [Coemansia reversa NRRL 1564]